MNHLECDKDGCKKLVYYVEWACDGMEYAFCKIHGDDFLINEQYPARIMVLNSQIRRTRKHIKCQNSTEGHRFPPPPKPKEPWEDNHNMVFDVATSSTLGFHGEQHTCIKCGYTYEDPMATCDFDITNIGNLTFDVPEGAVPYTPWSQSAQDKTSPKVTCI